MSAAEGLATPARSPRRLDLARIVAQPCFNRWLVPPAAVAIHLCIGMIYGMSVFWLPLAHTVGTACAADTGVLALLVTTRCNGTVPSLVVGFEIGIVFLGAAVPAGQGHGIGLGGLSPGVATAWLCVMAPMAWGLYVTLSRVAGLF